MSPLWIIFWSLVGAYLIVAVIVAALLLWLNTGGDPHDQTWFDAIFYGLMWPFLVIEFIVNILRGR